MMHFVFFLQTPQNCDRVIYSRFKHHNFLKTAFKSGIFFNILSVLIEGRRAYTVQFSARERWLEHVARINCTLSLASTHHRMKFINKQYDLTLLFSEIVKDSLQPLFELAPKFCPGDQCGKVKCQQSFGSHSFGHFAIYDPLRETLNNGGLPDARLSNQHWVVLCPAL